MRSKSKLWLLLSGASLAAMSAVAPALAQETSDEIVVTATGRSAAIQDVPLAVQAIPNAQLEQAGVHELRDLTRLAPTLAIDSGQSTTSGTIAQIRGVGTGSDNPGFEGAVGIFIDGVYRARAGAALADLPEVERVEVLRGPQGTLFGKNTSAGALSIVTAGPTHDFSAWGLIEGSELEDGDGLTGARSSFGVNMPVSDTLALRFDAALRGADGYIHDVTSGRDINDTNRWNARLQALWDLSPDASLRIIADGGMTNENCCGAVNLQSGTVVGALAGIYFPGALISDPAEERNMTVSPNRSYAEGADDFGLSGQLDWDVGGMHLTSITAYRNWSANRDQDVDFSSIDRAYRDGLKIGINSISEEIRLQGENGRVNWLVGAFVSRENLRTADRIRFGQDALAYANAATFFLTAGAGSARKLYDAPVQLFDPVTLQPLGITDVQACALSGGTASVCTSADNSQAGALLGVPDTLDVYLPDLNAGDGQQEDRWEVETQSIALFTHNEISLSDRLMLTLGARINHESKDLNANLLSRNDACSVLQNTAVPFDPDGAGPAPAGTYNLASLVVAQAGDGANVPFALACNAVTNTLANGQWSDSSDETEWSGTASLAYHLNDDVMIYGGYSRGYKAGGFNLDRSGFFGRDNLGAYEGAFGATGNWNVAAIGQASAPLTTESLRFDPEFTDAYELGLKSTLMGGRMYFNANLFYEQIHDYQSNSFSGFNFFTINVPELISQGVEIDLNARPTEALTLTAGLLYNDAFYDSDANFGGETISSGTQLSDAPKWTVTGSVNYRIPIGGNLAINLFADGRYVTEYAVQTLSRNPITDVDPFAIFDARISLLPEDERWSVELFARNLTDEFYNVGAFGAPERVLPASVFGGSTAAAQAASNYLVYPSEPRTVGVTVRARY